MNVHLDWSEILIRLGLAFLAGSIIGLNREEHGRAAGLRTTVLVCLAAAAAMILANLLMDTRGRPSDSYINMDVMRLPLGILTGVGFIGAGAILHKGNFVHGVTTAATLWFSTVMGLCLGAGQVALGLILLAAGIVILWSLKWVEDHFIHHGTASISLRLTADAGPPEDILRALSAAGCKCTIRELAYGTTGTEILLDVRHMAGTQGKVPEELISLLKTQAGVEKFRWKPTP